MKQAHWISITLFLQGNSMMARPGQKKRRWTDEEDRVLERVLFECKSRNWHLSWENIAKLTGLDRDGKSCWERWRRCENRQDPNVKREQFSQEENDAIIRLQLVYGNSSFTSWKSVAAHLPGRIVDDVKNRWHSSLKNSLKKKPGRSTGDQPHTTQPFHPNHNIDPNASSSSIPTSVSASEEIASIPNASSSSIPTSVSASEEIASISELACPEFPWGYLSSDNETIHHSFGGDYFGSWPWISGQVSASRESELMPTEEVTTNWSD